MPASMRLGPRPARAPPRDRSTTSQAAETGSTSAGIQSAAAVSATQGRSTSAPAQLPLNSAARQPGASGLTGPGPPHPGRPPQTPAEQRAVTAAWKRLWTAPVCNRTKTLAWRLMHGALPCGLYRAAHHSRTSDVHLCPQPGCRAQPNNRPLDSLSHIFLHCPAYKAARDWLQQIWHAVAGHTPPMRPDLLLADCVTAWPDYPQSSPLAHLWSALRLSWLFAVWVVHSGSNPSGRTAHAIVTLTIEALLQQMRVAFLSCSLEEDVLDVLPLRLIAQEEKPGTIAYFNASWGHAGVLCEAIVQPSGSATLDVRLSMEAPVPVPLVTGAATA